MTWSEHGGPHKTAPAAWRLCHTVLVRMAEHALDAPGTARASYMRAFCGASTLRRNAWLGGDTGRA